MSIEQMRKLMEAALPLYEQEVDENFITEPEQSSLDSPPGDAFRDSEPAQPMTVVANVDIPAMYMNAGDELYLEPTNNQGEAYSEENGLTYDWDFIFHLIRDKNMLDFKEDTEVAFAEDTSEDFKRSIQNPQWQERDEEETRKRREYLAKIADTGREDDLRYARVNTKLGKGTVYSINNMEPTDPSFPYLTVSVRLDSDPGPAGGGQQQHRWLLSDVSLLPEDDMPVEGIEEGIFGKPADKKSAIIKYAGHKAEDAIRYCNLGKEMWPDHPSAKNFENIRQELIELKKWLRERK